MGSRMRPRLLRRPGPFQRSSLHVRKVHPMRIFHVMHAHVMHAALVAACLATSPATSPVLAAPAAPPVESLLKLSLEELTQIDVTIASRGVERLERTAAAVSVITCE